MPEYADYTGIAWYRRQLTLPPIAGEAHVRLRFGAVFYLAQVWWNGVYLGEHEGGYTPFEFDVSGLARPGAANVLAVRVDNQRAMDRLPAALSYALVVRLVALWRDRARRAPSTSPAGRSSHTSGWWPSRRWSTWAGPRQRPSRRR